MEQQLATFNVGDSFGEMSLIDKQPRSASISALSDGELLEFTKESFETIMGYTQKLQIKLLQNLVNDVSLKLRRTNDRLLHLM